MERVSLKLLGGLVVLLILSAGIGFFMPPIWSFDDIPTNCTTQTGSVSNKTEIANGFYTEYHLLLNNNSLSVSPATYLVAEEGEVISIFVCN